MPLRSMAADRFVRFLRSARQDQSRYTFFIGAGCSVSSGIPSAGDLVKHIWLPTLRDQEAPDATDMHAWTSKRLSNYDPKHPAGSYGDVMEALLPSPGHRQREIEQLCRGKVPSFGYAVLATLMATEGEAFNVALTTNFDDLLADALYLFTRARPLVAHHESLAGFIRRVPTRTLIVKLHGDNRLVPFNTTDERSLLDAGTVAAVQEVLHGCGLVFLGYGGNDEGIRDMFESLPKTEPSHGVYWVSGTEPTGTLRPWLESRNSIWVKHRDFDELMLLVKDAFDLPHGDVWRFEEIVHRYESTYKTTAYRVHSLPNGSPNAAALKRAVGRTDQSLPGWWAIEAMASGFKKDNPVLSDDMYAQGVKQFPHAAPLLGNYANFLKDVRQAYDRAEAMYERAIAADPQNPIVLGDFAVFLWRNRRDYQRAEDLFRRSFAADPQYAINLSNYANYHRMVRSDLDTAEDFHERAVRAEPYHPHILGAYAAFLWGERKCHDQAEEIFLRALELDPAKVENLLLYASFLYDVRGNNDLARANYHKALSIGVPNDNLLGNYATFLWHVEQDLDRAEDFFKRAIAAENDDIGRSMYLANYANFIRLERKNQALAASLYEQAIQADPKNVTAMVLRASHLSACGEAPNEEVERLFQEALDLDPVNPFTLGNFGAHLAQQRQEHECAELQIARAFEADPKEASHRGNLTGVHFILRKDEGALAHLEALLRRPDATAPTALNVELWFYAYAHGPVDQRKHALNELRQILETGARSIDWNLSANVKRAVQDGHPEAAYLEKLAAVGSGNAELVSLDAWDAWRGLAQPEKS